MMKILDSQFEVSAFVEKELIKDRTPKIVFIGRSNVGKSSLINKLFGKKNLARTSAKPGKTVSINYFRVTTSTKKNLFFVDLPGYGYAKISKSEANRVKSLITSFFETVQNVKLVVILIDSRRGFMESDIEVLSEIIDKNFKLLTVLTKSDKLHNSELISQKNNLQKQFGLNVISFTIKSNENKEEMLNIINNSLLME